MDLLPCCSAILFVYRLALPVFLLAACAGPFYPQTFLPISPAPELPGTIASSHPTPSADTPGARDLPGIVPSPTPSPQPALGTVEYTIFVPVVERASPPPTPSPEVITFAVIGDYGGGGQPEADVAALVAGWAPDFVVTTGDNNYPNGAAETIDKNIGQFYHAFIYPYLGGYGEGADVNRFFPSLGNHDWNTDNAQPYLDYFTLPGNERYYDFTWGQLHFFVLDSDSREADGVGASSAQADWLRQGLAESITPWQVVVAHHPPYSSGIHGPVDWMRWPFAGWGADLVLSGHDHTYERIHRDGIVYVINGLGGGSIYPFAIIDEGSQLRYNDNYGAMLVEAGEGFIRFQFINRTGELIDAYELVIP